LTSLFDLNVLIAMFDEEHIHYERAHRWWGRNRQHGWASCPITQNGFVRVVSQPSYSNSIPVTDAIALLRRAVAHRDHTFWPDDLSVVDPAHFDHTQIRAPRQLTDLYLLALAVKNDGRLVTMDDAISIAAVPAARPRHLVVI
jgi:toxin-antitoxin system PIN domain toxin